MQISNNTILITGGGTGIGRALAIAFHQRGNRVIVAGRRQSALDEVAAAYPGIETAVLDARDPADIARFGKEISEKYPTLNVLINNAGIMQIEDWKTDVIDLSIAAATIETNLLAPIQLTGALLPTLKKQPSATVMTVSSGLAFLPLAATPTYSATKAAIHSFSESLRFQLKDTSVEVLELAPPYVQTTLMGAHQEVDPHAMPLDEFIAEVIDIIEHQPEAREILVKRVYPLRFAAGDEQENYLNQFNGLNSRG